MDRDVVRLDFASRPSALPYMVRAMWPAARRRGLAPQIVARWRGHKPEPRDLAEFRRITDACDEHPGFLPLLYPHTFGFRLAMAILTHPKFPVPIWGVLQVRNHLEQYAPIAADAALDFETSVLRGRVVAKGAEFDLRTTVCVERTLVWQSDLTFFARGRFGEPEAASPLARSPTEFGEAIAEWTLDDADHVRFGRYTGDYNGIHLWDWYARRMGFARALYHPPRVLGQCLARLPRSTQLHDGAQSRLRLDAWIKGPVPHGSRVRLHAAATKMSTSVPSDRTFALFAGDERPSLVGRLQRGEADGNADRDAP